MAPIQDIRNLQRMQALLILIFLLLPLITPSLHITASRAGPFRVVVREVNNCSKEIRSGESILDLHVSPARPEQQAQYVVGRIVLYEPITDAHQGERAVHNQTIKIELPEFPIFPYGRWQAHISMQQPNIDIISHCVRMEVDIVPKKSGSEQSWVQYDRGIDFNTNDQNDLSA